MGVWARRGLLARALDAGGLGGCIAGLRDVAGRVTARQGQRTVARHAVDRGWVRQRTWALPSDMRRLWVPGPDSGRPYLGVIGRVPARTLAAELEVQPMVVAPPALGKSTGFVVPWLLDHDGPALVLTTKRPTCTRRPRRTAAALGRVWVYDPFGEERSAGFTPAGAGAYVDAARSAPARRWRQRRTPIRRTRRTSFGTRRQRR